MDKGIKQDKRIDKTKERGDLRKQTPKRKQDDIPQTDVQFPDRGDAAVVQRTNRIKINEFDIKRATKRSKFKNISTATVGHEKNTVKPVQKQALSHLDIRRLIRERYTLRKAAIQAANLKSDVNGGTNNGVRDEVAGTAKINSKPQVKSDRTVNRSTKLIPEHQPQLKLQRNPEPIKEKPLDTTTVDIAIKRPDKETTFRIPKKELNRKLDKELTYKNPDKDFTFRPDKETTTKKSDKETISRKQDKESFHRYPDKESTFRILDTTTKKPDKDAIYRKPDKEPIYRKPDKEPNIRKPDKELINRKPIIKTVTPRNTSQKIYKAVTFGNYRDSKPQPKPLQINIPSNEKPSNILINNKVTKSTDTVTLKPKPRMTKEKPDIRRKIIRKRIRKTGHDSPDSFKFRKNESPPTEVAKWAPCCVNRHTKPYYEAWVNTTLAAISKSSKKDKWLLEKRSIIQSFQRALEERAESPELVYEKLKDERYTGRIRVISHHR